MANVIKFIIKCMVLIWLYDAVDGKVHKVPYPEEALLNTDELITRNGYPLEIHYVITRDGYILKIQRIPLGPHCTSGNRKPYPLIAFHALATSSRSFVIINKGFAFVAADHCYDVWLPNTRGTYESDRNVFFSPNQTRFWEFGVYEKSVYDLPAVIDYVLHKTKAPQVQYLGHSEGASIAFVLASLFPEYSARTIRSIQAVGPAAFVKHSKTPLYKLFSSNLPYFEYFLGSLGIVEIPPFMEVSALVSKNLCRLQEPVSLNLCAQVIFYFAGNGEENFNATSYLTFFGFIPAGFSVRELLIGTQLHLSGKFQRYNFYENNFRAYGQNTPPEYPIENIRVPIYLYAADNDLAADYEDLKHFTNLAPGSSIVNNSEFSQFNHLDYLFGNNVDIINRKILGNLALYD